MMIIIRNDRANIYVTCKPEEDEEEEEEEGEQKQYNITCVKANQFECVEKYLKAT
jgi:HEPN domain-containing protein